MPDSQELNQAPDSRRQLLLVDDELTLRKLLDLLAEEDYELRRAESAAEALEKLRALGEASTLVVVASGGEYGAQPEVDGAKPETLSFLRLAQELASAREKANRDALTGVKSKHAFSDAERRWDGRIAAGEAPPFAVAFCDPNGLKKVNDTLGHAAGDRYICEACRLICNTFKHSPVYRIGGDEFVAILSGADYDERAALLAALETENEHRAQSGGIQIACGLAEFRPGEDASFSAVFERADAAMYADKKRLKLLE